MKSLWFSFSSQLQHHFTLQGPCYTTALSVIVLHLTISNKVLNLNSLWYEHCNAKCELKPLEDHKLSSYVTIWTLSNVLRNDNRRKCVLIYKWIWFYGMHKSTSPPQEAKLGLWQRMWNHLGITAEPFSVTTNNYRKKGIYS